MPKGKPAMFNPRPMQQAVLSYTGGLMGVSAVPGSGKTQTLSYLAAHLILESELQDDQEILIVTLVNSAVDNFTRRIANFIKGYGLLPDLGYRVRTLHGLAHDIVRERPDLVGLSNQFQIVDEREADEILRNAAQSWLRSHPEFIEQFTSPEIDLPNDRYAMQQWPELVTGIAHNFIRQAKDLQATPADIEGRLADLQIPEPLLQLGVEVYSDYQRALNYRNAVDFDDLIRLALNCLKFDPDYLARLRYRWPFILEDEAQDSSRIQEEILKSLAGEDGNWVRVGDPNQAIYETFTTASPQFLLNFRRRPDVASLDLPNSGRSTLSIIRLANTLIDWTRNAHPNENLREALSPPLILPTPLGDPQPNPPDNPDGVIFSKEGFTPEREVDLVVKSLKRWVPEHLDQTVAVLVPRNERGAEIVESLKRAGLDYIELLRSSLSTRQTSGILATILRYLSDPSSSFKLSRVYQSIRTPDETGDKLPVKEITALLHKCSQLEEYLWPKPDRDWLARIDAGDDTIHSELEGFRTLIHRWQAATLLPVDQLVLTISQDLFTLPADLALAHKLALVLEQAAQSHPDWQLPEFAEELDTVARNERKFLGFTDEDSGFDPDQYKGKVVVATVHKAKGLEWDRVYLLSLNNYDFPSAEPYDSFISEKWFIRNRLNLEAETLAKLNALLAGDTAAMFEEEGNATWRARLDYAAERLRLLFVGITRARKELILTWNTGRRADCQPALAFGALQSYWEGENHAATD
jgi:DNA helicase-2/ATP-dependent DNA helicase PcrA